jgi:transposase
MSNRATALNKILFVGLDIHKDNHAACLVNCFGHKLMDLEVKDRKADFDQLLIRVNQIAAADRLCPIFGLEDSYGNGQRLANYLKRGGYEVKTISPVEVDRKRRYATHPEKSDSLDALGVAKVLIEKIDSLPTYSLTKTDELSKELRELNNDRHFLVAEQSRLKNQLHVLLHRSYGSVYQTLFKNIFSLKALKYWHRHPLPTKEWRDGLAIGHSDILTGQIRRKIKRLINIKNEIKEIEAELASIVEQTGQKLQTMNGCGLVTTAAILAEVKNIDRFRSPQALAKYAGLAPREKSSGKSRKLLKSRSGNRRLNQAIHHVALTQISRSGNEIAKAYFQKKIKEGKSKVQALCCLKRRLGNIIYMMLKHRQEYNYHGAS